ncbi:MAG: c-type cytochrome [Gammaproteobacteria bacterium]|nr:c-type cytochrome [Gammaproteobacteria bacterium]
MAQNTATAIVSEIFRFVWAVLKMIWRLVKSPGRLVPDIDGMELNKIMAAVLLAGVIGMTSGFLADLLVHEPKVEQFAYAPDVEAGPAEVAVEEEPEIDIATLLQTADPSAGEAFSRACASCHTFEQGGANRVGPNLWGVVGRDKGAVADFNYSSAMEEAGSDWTYENLNAFLHNPRDYLPGTSMSYAGIRDAEDRANIIAYMRTMAEDPVPLPEPPAEEETAAAEGEDAAADEGTGAEGADAAAGEGAAEGEGGAAEGEGAAGEGEGAAEGEGTAEEGEEAGAPEDASTGESSGETGAESP